MIKNDPEVQEILKRCYRSTKTCAKVLFPESYSGEFSPLHDQIVDAFDSNEKKVAIAAPRGIGKTTLTRTYVSKRILFRDCHFICYISNSATMAAMQTENIKRELLTNRVVKRLFGSVKISDHTEAGLDESFSKEAWVAFGNTLVLPRGWDQQIRGLVWDKYRPDVFVFDDMEKKKELKNEELREGMREWFYSDAMKAISRYDKDWKMIYIDTLKHEDSLLQHLLESPDWKDLVLSACDSNYKSLAPSYMSDEDIMEEVESHRRDGNLDIFVMEYMNQPASAEDANFQSGYFKYYNETDADFIKDEKPKLENLVIIDPAKTVKLHSKESAIVGVGINLATSKIFVRDIVSRKMYPDELYNEMFKMLASLKALVLAVEVTSLNEFIKQPISNEIIKRRVGIGEPVWLNARASKEDRVAQLAPYYRQGYIYHNKACCGGLEAQLMSFPRSKLWDIMDAFAYIIELLELGGRYFEPTSSETDEDIEAEFRELEKEYEPPLTGWRFA